MQVQLECQQANHDRVVEEMEKSIAELRAEIGELQAEARHLASQYDSTCIERDALAEKHSELSAILVSRGGASQILALGSTDGAAPVTELHAAAMELRERIRQLEVENRRLGTNTGEVEALQSRLRKVQAGHTAEAHMLNGRITELEARVAEFESKEMLASEDLDEQHAQIRSLQAAHSKTVVKLHQLISELETTIANSAPKEELARVLDEFDSINELLGKERQEHGVTVGELHSKIAEIEDQLALSLAESRSRVARADFDHVCLQRDSLASSHAHEMLSLQHRLEELEGLNAEIEALGNHHNLQAALLMMNAEQVAQMRTPNAVRNSQQEELSSVELYAEAAIERDRLASLVEDLEAREMENLVRIEQLMAQLGCHVGADGSTVAQQPMSTIGGYVLHRRQSLAFYAAGFYNFS
jgi:uncharacterized coiled-coil protein SlyX